MKRRQFIAWLISVAATAIGGCLFRSKEDAPVKIASVTCKLGPVSADGSRGKMTLTYDGITVAGREMYRTVDGAKTTIHFAIAR